MNTYAPRKTVDIEAVEQFIIVECKPVVRELLCNLENRLLFRAKRIGVKNFGPIQAHELALRMFQRTGGDILFL